MFILATSWQWFRKKLSTGPTKRMWWGAPLVGVLDLSTLAFFIFSPLRCCEFVQKVELVKPRRRLSVGWGAAANRPDSARNRAGVAQGAAANQAMADYWLWFAVPHTKQTGPLPLWIT